MRIVFVGCVTFSLRALDRILANGWEVVGVCTLRESTFNADHADLTGLCEDHAIPWLDAVDLNAPEALAWVRARRPDVIFCFGWSRLLKRELLEISPMGVVGFHPAALPANRGRHPLIWALVLGLKETASTFFFMDEGADSGDILSQYPITITDADDAASLYARMTDTALSQIDAFLPQLVSGRYPRLRQDESRATNWRKRGRADGMIDWRMSARSVHNLVRGLSRPYVGAGFEHDGIEYKLWKTTIVTDVPENAEPGKVVSMVGGAPVVRCGEQGIMMLDVEPLPSLEVGVYV